MSDVFISYSRKDTAIIDKICAEFEEIGISYWIDRKGIAGGEQWRKEIVEAITSSSFFVIAISINSTQSANVLKELNIAESRKKKILPVIIDRANIPPEMEYQLAGLQNIDLTSDFAEGVKQLFRALGRSSNKVKQQPPSPPRKVQLNGKGAVNLVRKNPSTYDAGRGGNYGIWIDNVKAGAMAYGDKIRLIQDTGAHIIFVEWMGIKSNKLQFYLTSDQEIDLVCGEEQGTLLGRLFIRTATME